MTKKENPPPTCSKCGVVWQNPIAQAKILNRAKSDMNIIVGLCVGHDMLFAKYSKAPVTTLVVKDRVTNHNPAAVLYGLNFYYKRLQKQPVIVPE